MTGVVFLGGAYPRLLDRELLHLHFVNGSIVTFEDISEGQEDGPERRIRDRTRHFAILHIYELAFAASAILPDVLATVVDVFQCTLQRSRGVVVLMKSHREECQDMIE